METGIIAGYIGVMAGLELLQIGSPMDVAWVGSSTLWPNC